MQNPTFQHKLIVVLSYGFAVGLRDKRFNTDHDGAFMVLEGTIADAESDFDLPFRGNDGSGPWCIVGNDLAQLVDEAFDWASCFDHFNDVLADVLAGGNGLLSDKGESQLNPPCT